MDKSTAILRAADSLRSAADGAAWEQLAQMTRALAPQLDALAAAGPLSSTERAALLRLREAHDHAADAVAAAADALKTRMDDMQANKDGWIAYAMQEA
jgi:ethanolamine ammonia-lyase small subunit